MRDELTVAARRRRFLVPLALFAVILLALYLGLGRDPSHVPSARVGKPVPDLVLPAIEGFEPGFTPQDFHGQVVLVNYFASWCASCRDEHPLLMEVAQVYPIYGIAYRDNPVDSARWLSRHGNPYRATAADVGGRAGIEWGVRGVPETFIVGSDGIVLYRHTGPITSGVWRDVFIPILRDTES